MKLTMAKQRKQCPKFTYSSRDLLTWSHMDLNHDSLPNMQKDLSTVSECEGKVRIPVSDSSLTCRSQHRVQSMDMTHHMNITSGKRRTPERSRACQLVPQIHSQVQEVITSNQTMIAHLDYSEVSHTSLGQEHLPEYAHDPILTPTSTTVTTRWNRTWQNEIDEKKRE